MTHILLVSHSVGQQIECCRFSAEWLIRVDDRRDYIARAHGSISQLTPVTPWKSERHLYRLQQRIQADPVSGSQPRDWAERYELLAAAVIVADEPLAVVGVVVQVAGVAVVPLH